LPRHFSPRSCLTILKFLFLLFDSFQNMTEFAHPPFLQRVLKFLSLEIFNSLRSVRRTRADLGQFGCISKARITYPDAQERFVCFIKCQVGNIYQSASTILMYCKLLQSFGRFLKFTPLLKEINVRCRLRQHLLVTLLTHFLKQRVTRHFYLIQKILDVVSAPIFIGKVFFLVLQISRNEYPKMFNFSQSHLQL
jgi:hypothetical protein